MLSPAARSADLKKLPILAASHCLQGKPAWMMWAGGGGINMVD